MGKIKKYCDYSAMDPFLAQYQITKVQYQSVIALSDKARNRVKGEF